jgi:PDZ domain-containing protein
MSAAGALTRAARIACGLGCAIALAGALASPACAADGEESPTAEVWSKAVPADGGEAAAPVTPPAALPDKPSSGVLTSSPSYSLPMTITTPDSGELRAVPVTDATPPPNLTNSPSDESGAPGTTQEIPAATTASAASAPAPSQNQDIDTPTTPAPSNGEGQFDLDSPDVRRYEREQSGMIDPQQFGNMNSFLAEGSFSSPIGVELREGRRKLSDGEEADGLMVLEVVKGSPAATAGLHGYKHTAHTAMAGVALATAMLVFPPAIFVLPVLDYTHAGESYDMIIGVDGSRVSNSLDFEDRMHDVRPGEIVYLSVLRDGKRAQIRVYLPPSSNLTW